MRAKIQNPTRSAPVVGVIATGYVEALTLAALSGAFMTALFRAVAGLRGAGEEEVERAGRWGFIVGVLLALAIGCLEVA